jgi:hypothetical protein
LLIEGSFQAIEPIIWNFDHHKFFLSSKDGDSNEKFYSFKNQRKGKDSELELEAGN